MRIPVAGAAVTVLAALAVFVFPHGKADLPTDSPTTVHWRPPFRTRPRPTSGSMPPAEKSRTPGSGIQSATGVTPNLAMYFSAWFEPFQTGFAVTAARHGAVPLVQINPAHVSLTAIASGKYDAYLSDYAAAVSAYGHPVILSFGHEMNAPWYSWGYRHASPAAFVAAWRHIVTLFRELRVRNVTWLWTVNVIHERSPRITDPRPWWPGSSYVNWVGIDGYYYGPSWAFAPLFGPTIVKYGS